MGFISYSMYFVSLAGRLDGDGVKMRRSDNLSLPDRLEAFAVCWDGYDKAAARP